MPWWLTPSSIWVFIRIFIISQLNTGYKTIFSNFLHFFQYLSLNLKQCGKKTGTAEVWPEAAACLSGNFIERSGNKWKHASRVSPCYRDNCQGLAQARTLARCSRKQTAPVDQEYWLPELFVSFIFSLQDRSHIYCSHWCSSLCQYHFSVRSSHTAQHLQQRSSHRRHRPTSALLRSGPWRNRIHTAYWSWSSGDGRTPF